MPRYANKKSFQLGAYWLSKRPNSPAWCRTWFDPKTRQTCRASLGTADFEEARQRLTDWFILNETKRHEQPSDVTLAEVFARYYEQYGSQQIQADSVQRALRYWLEFHGEASIVEACDLPRQQAFQLHLTDKRKLAPNTVRQVITLGKAALNWSWKRGEIAAVPFIQLPKVPKPEPKGRPLEIKELARLINAADYHVQVFIVLMIATSGRNSAVLDLAFPQIDMQSDLITLNPSGRAQTLKYRPTVKIPPSLKPWLVACRNLQPDEPLVAFNGKKVQSVKSAWRRLRTDLKLDADVQPYGIRHTMARWMRKSGVPAWEVAAQLGHKTPGVTTTEIYAPFDPDYLKASTDAIDAFLHALACELRASSISDYLIGRIESLKTKGNSGAPEEIRTPDPQIRRL